MFLATTTVFVGKFFVEKAVDLKFKSDISKTTQTEASPIIIANPVTKEDIENIYGSEELKGSFQPTHKHIDHKDQTVRITHMDELAAVVRNRGMLMEVL